VSLVEQMSGHSAPSAPPCRKAHVFVIETYDYYRNKIVKNALRMVYSNFLSI
jgi:Zn-dependent metalloprotease